jgi:hypothetical protein
MRLGFRLRVFAVRFFAVRFLGVMMGHWRAVIPAMLDHALWTDFFPTAFVEAARRAGQQQYDHNQQQTHLMPVLADVIRDHFLGTLAAVATVGHLKRHRLPASASSLSYWSPLKRNG